MYQTKVQGELHSSQISPLQKIQVILENSYAKTIERYSSLQVSCSKRDDIPQIVNNMKGIVETICKDEKVLNYCMEMRLVRECNLYEKAVLTSVFAGLLAGAYGCRIGIIQNIMMAGLLHDSGCLEMTFLLGKQSRTPQEECVWKEHPTYGYYFAIQNELPREMADIIRYHEERYDGSGYPKALKGDEISLGARIVAVCANVAGNIVYNGMKPHEALEALCGASGVCYDPKLVDLFMGSVSFYPMGAMVRLSTGEIGIVTDIRKNSGARPIVTVHYNSVNRPLVLPKVVDLGEETAIFVEEILG